MIPLKDLPETVSVSFKSISPLLKEFWIRASMNCLEGRVFGHDCSTGKFLDVI